MSSFYISLAIKFAVVFINEVNILTKKINESVIITYILSECSRRHILHHRINVIFSIKMQWKYHFVKLYVIKDFRRN